LERTLVLIKPDAVERGLVGEIIADLKRGGCESLQPNLYMSRPVLLKSITRSIKGNPFMLDWSSTSLPNH